MDATMHILASLCAVSQGTRALYERILDVTSANMPDPLQRAWGDSPEPYEIFDPSTLCDPSYRESPGFLGMMWLVNPPSWDSWTTPAASPSPSPEAASGIDLDVGA